MARTVGPPPKRSEQRRRRNATPPVDRAPSKPARALGPAPPDWLEGLGRHWYESLRRSGQAVYYTASDWSSALVIAKAVEKFEERPSAHMLSAILSGFSTLAVTEGERRRMRLELERSPGRDEDDEAAVAALEGWRDRLAG